MESLNRIWDPKEWYVESMDMNLLDSSDVVYTMIIGTGDDCYGESIEILISKDNYKKILTGEYTYFVYPYLKPKLLLFDINGNLVPLVKNTIINEDHLSLEQQIDIATHRLVRQKSNLKDLGN